VDGVDGNPLTGKIRAPHCRRSGIRELVPAGRLSSSIENASPSSAPSSAMRSVTTCTTLLASTGIEAAADAEVQRHVIAGSASTREDQAAVATIPTP
jgi:hypothetical protein